MADLEPVLSGLEEESADLDALVADLSPADWAKPTPAPGWTIAHQIAHLAWTDQQALLAATDEAGFQQLLTTMGSDANPAGLVDKGAADGAQRDPQDLLADWRQGRADLAAALRKVAPGTKLPWFGPPMSTLSMSSARQMETWAHGQDVADTLGVTREPAMRLRNVANIGVRTRDFAFVVHSKTPPAEPFLVELTAPDGSTWSWGPADATSRVTGPALDFCLLATQRRHRDDLALTASTAEASEWLDIAQAFAGAPGEGREPS